MSILVCTACDRPFDAELQTDAEYLPLPKCDDCVRELEEQRVQWWHSINNDEQWIEENA